MELLITCRGTIAYGSCMFNETNFLQHNVLEGSFKLCLNEIVQNLRIWLVNRLLKSLFGGIVALITICM